jgi:hypothetical protein
MKIVKFFLIIWGKWSELELEFLASWIRSRTQIDRLCNTALSINDPNLFPHSEDTKAGVFLPSDTSKLHI